MAEPAQARSPALPFEIWAKVFAHVQSDDPDTVTEAEGCQVLLARGRNRTLLSALCVCKEWHGPAHDELYTNLHLDWTAGAAKRLLETMDANPALIERVRSLRSCFMTQLGWTEAWKLKNAERWAAVRVARYRKFMAAFDVFQCTDPSRLVAIELVNPIISDLTALILSLCSMPALRSLAIFPNAALTLPTPTFAENVSKTSLQHLLIPEWPTKYLLVALPRTLRSLVVHTSHDASPLRSSELESEMPHLASWKTEYLPALEVLAVVVFGVNGAPWDYASRARVESMARNAEGFELRVVASKDDGSWSLPRLPRQVVPDLYASLLPGRWEA